MIQQAMDSAVTMGQTSKNSFLFLPTREVGIVIAERKYFYGGSKLPMLPSSLY
jgi:hypothetical protein